MPRVLLIVSPAQKSQIRGRILAAMRPRDSMIELQERLSRALTAVARNEGTLPLIFQVHLARDCRAEATAFLSALVRL